MQRFAGSASICLHGAARRERLGCREFKARSFGAANTPSARLCTDEQSCIEGPATLSARSQATERGRGFQFQRPDRGFSGAAAPVLAVVAGDAAQGTWNPALCLEPAGSADVSGRAAASSSAHE
mmetsp:Transcript_69266/g.224705  ORF Transcript_69266/g.224705 Transcript_69266/m.224705 type:complete len:124 (-) Transcript_69266:215-586(-)